MNNSFKFYYIPILLISILLLNGCEKDDPDPADQFIGDYTYTMTVSGDISGSFSGEFTIIKTSPDKITITEGSSNTINTVIGNSIVEDSGQTVDFPIENGGTASFTEQSTGILDGKVLTINGSWTRTGYNIQAFIIVATKKK